jgi:hypothetical protein
MRGIIKTETVTTTQIKEDIYTLVKNNNGTIKGSYIIEKLGNKYNVLNKEVGKLLNELVEEQKIKIQLGGIALVK